MFTTPAEFERRVEAGGFLEWTEFLGNYYGTPDPGSCRDADVDVVLEIEVDGAQQVKRRYPDAMLIFVLPPSRDEQERRLRGRGDPDDKVLARLRKAEVEEPIGRDARRSRRGQRRPRHDDRRDGGHHRNRHRVTR